VLYLGLVWGEVIKKKSIIGLDRSKLLDYSNHNPQGLDHYQRISCLVLPLLLLLLFLLLLSFPSHVLRLLRLPSNGYPPVSMPKSSIEI